MELILSSRKKLIDKYGYHNFKTIDFTLNRLKNELQKDGLRSIIIYVDDSNFLRPYGLRPANPNNPEEIKNLIDNFQKRVETDGVKIEYFLIIGGDDIIPFFRIPNPVYGPNGDPDKEIYSDSPYASTDDEYLVPERALGRIPDINSNNPKFLLDLLEHIIKSHDETYNSEGDFGYSAEVWKEASEDVYQAMGRSQGLIYSPPIVARTLRKSFLNKKKLLYFNLHGMERTASWYGELKERGILTVAFNASQLDTIEVEQAVIFSEACYSANIFTKEPDSSIPLKFLERNVDCFVGSTMISYGAIAPPLTNADVLAKYFFQYVREGLPYGIAFLNAKQDYAKKMIRLGLFHVDEVDAKTLLEFVLYGDPSITWEKMETERELVHTEIINGVIRRSYRRRKW
ncbi:MAG: hypothetical protein GTO02_20005 [Candidatus Dadabacteria bacterium]|nr:hypothetical protein [Candidatus Dadabacteria bacterium]NIQ16582.1 hypothetical protein [Candidatus Dadabacteria bacterium]